MINKSRIVKPGPNGKLIGEYGETLSPPVGWSFLPAGDAGITRKVTAKGEFWRVQIKKGKRLTSKGVWAPTLHIQEAKNLVETIRSTDEYAQKREYQLKRRDIKQEEYTSDFTKSIKNYLNFHAKYVELENVMAKRVCAHAIPIGSGTVARTSLIPIEDRASRAVIAWMRHQTTFYDQLKIPHIKGERRAVRREFAQQSVKLLNKYRDGKMITPTCPLFIALKNKTK